jgi:hypothetical protein
MKYLLLLLLLMSCSSLVPSLPTMSTSVGSSAPAATTVGQVSKDIESSLWSYSWIAIILTFMFPSLRAPLVFFLKSIFGLLALFPDLATKHVRMLYNNKYNNGKEET